MIGKLKLRILLLGWGKMRKRYLVPVVHLLKKQAFSGLNEHLVVGIWYLAGREELSLTNHHSLFTIHYLLFYANGLSILLGKDAKDTRTFR